MTLLAASGSAPGPLLDRHRTRKKSSADRYFAGEFPCAVAAFSSNDRSNKEPTATSPVAASNVLTRSMWYWLVAATDVDEQAGPAGAGCFVARSGCYDADTATAMASAHARAHARTRSDPPTGAHPSLSCSLGQRPARLGRIRFRCRRRGGTDRSIGRPVARVQPHALPPCQSEPSTSRAQQQPG